MTKIKAALHEHLKTSSKLREDSFNLALDRAIYRLGEQSLFSVVDFDDKRYKKFIELQKLKSIEIQYPDFSDKGCFTNNMKVELNISYIGDDKRAMRIWGLGGALDILCIHGEEVPTRQGHLLVLGLGYETHIKHNRNVEDIIKEARDYNPDATIIGDHPNFLSGIGKYLENHLELLEPRGINGVDGLDALEGFNGEAVFGNKRTLKFYQEHKSEYPKLGFISSSDGHSFYEFCRSWTKIEMPDTNSAEKFSETFRKAVQNTDDETLCRRKLSLRGFAGHAGKMIIVKFADKIGLEYFNKGIERPDNK